MISESEIGIGGRRAQALASVYRRELLWAAVDHCGSDPTCRAERLCDRCYGRELLAKRRQAGVIGQCWAERICRGDLRARPSWPEHEPKTLEIARRLVGRLTQDPRLLDELAVACSKGAADWWQRRPARYRL